MLCHYLLLRLFRAKGTKLAMLALLPVVFRPLASMLQGEERDLGCLARVLGLRLELFYGTEQGSGARQRMQAVCDLQLGLL